MHHRSHRSGIPFALGLLAAAGLAIGAASLLRRRHLDHGEEDAPRRSLNDPDTGSERLVGRTMTIAKPRDEVYRAWRDFTRFPTFMENVEAVAVLDERRSRWSVSGPAGTTVEFTATITEDRPGEAIAWTSDEDATVPNSGRITFRDAPGGRGTEVDLDIAYEPPAGVIGTVIAKMFQREPDIQARRDLKRFKQLLETGEIATSSPRPARSTPSALCLSRARQIVRAAAAGIRSTIDGDHCASVQEAQR